MDETRTDAEVLNDLKACLGFRCINCSYSGRKNKRCVDDLMAEVEEKMGKKYGGSDEQDRV